MLDIVTIAGCPSPISRSTAVLHYINQLLKEADLHAETILIRQLPATDLRFGNVHSPIIQQHCASIQQASGIILGTPIHKGAHSEGLQAFLQLLPHDLLVGKVVLPVASGQREDDFGAVDTILRSFLTERRVGQLLAGVYIQEHHVHLHNRQVYLDDPAKGYLYRGIGQLLRELTADSTGLRRPVATPAVRPALPSAFSSRAALLNAG